MTQQYSILVSDTEKRILAALRELPDGQLRQRLETFLLELTEFVRDPRCAEVQADGIPCDSPERDCEQCMRVEEMLRTLRSALPNNAAVAGIRRVG